MGDVGFDTFEAADVHEDFVSEGLVFLTELELGVRRLIGVDAQLDHSQPDPFEEGGVDGDFFRTCRRICAVEVGAGSFVVFPFGVPPVG